MITATKSLTFCAAHRLLGHEGRCRFIHGHNYVVDVTVQGDLDAVGRVVDFTTIKKLCAAVLDNWDHAAILCKGDPLIEPLIVNGQAVVVLSCNPTAENMADMLLRTFALKVSEVAPHVSVVRVRVWETPASSAERDNG